MPAKRHSSRRAGSRGNTQKPVKTVFTYELAADVSYGKLTTDELATRRPTILHAAMVTRTELKYREAEYFLDLLRRNLHHEAAVLYHLSALLGALRGITLVLQAECADVPQFHGWYEQKRALMRQNIALRLLVELRNDAVHKGIDPPNVTFTCLQRSHRDGKKTSELVLETFALHGVSFPEPLRALDDALLFMRGLVLDAKNAGFLAVPASARRPVSIAARTLVEEADGTWRELPGPRSWGSGKIRTYEHEDRQDLR